MPLSPFTLTNVLCVPSIHQNLISVSKFCCSKNTSIEFFPSYTVVKDLQARKPLLLGTNRHDLYEWPNASTSNNNSTMAFSTTVSV